MLLCCSQRHVFAPVLRGEWLGFARIVFPSRNEEGDRCLMVKGFCRAVISLLAVKSKLYDHGCENFKGTVDKRDSK